MYGICPRLKDPLHQRAGKAWKGVVRRCEEWCQINLTCKTEIAWAYGVRRYLVMPTPSNGTWTIPQSHNDYLWMDWWSRCALWRQTTWPTLAQVMACCLRAPSYLLNQCWVIINHSHEGNFTANAEDVSLISVWKQIKSRIHLHFPGSMS